jgi:HEAT repeat protein
VRLLNARSFCIWVSNMEVTEEIKQKIKNLQKDFLENEGRNQQVLTKQLLDFAKDEIKFFDTFDVAIRNLGYIMEERAVPILLELLKWDFHRLQHEIIFSLGRIGDNRAVEPLIALLANQELAFFAVVALGDIGDEKAIQPILELLRQHTVPDYYQFTTAEALFKLGYRGDELLYAFINILRNEEYDYHQNYNAATYLGRFGDKRAVEPLITALESVSEAIRNNSVSALSELKDLRAFEPLLKTLQNTKEKHWIRIMAALSLAELQDSRAFEPLVEFLYYLLDRFTNPQMAKIADDLQEIQQQDLTEDLNAGIWTLGILGDKRAIPVLYDVRELLPDSIFIIASLLLLGENQFSEQFSAIFTTGMGFPTLGYEARNFVERGIISVRQARDVAHELLFDQERDKRYLAYFLLKDLGEVDDLALLNKAFENAGKWVNFERHQIKESITAIKHRYRI